MNLEMSRGEGPRNERKMSSYRNPKWALAKAQNRQKNELKTSTKGSQERVCRTARSLYYSNRDDHGRPADHLVKNALNEVLGAT